MAANLIGALLLAAFGILWFFDSKFVDAWRQRLQYKKHIKPHKIDESSRELLMREIEEFLAAEEARRSATHYFLDDSNRDRFSEVSGDIKKLIAKVMAEEARKENHRGRRKSSYYHWVDNNNWQWPNR